MATAYLDQPLAAGQPQAGRGQLGSASLPPMQADRQFVFPQRDPIHPSTDRFPAGTGENQFRRLSDDR